MKTSPAGRTLAAAAALLVLGPIGAAGGRLVSGGGGPLQKIVTLLKDLKADIVKDGQLEQQTYYKYACWCETATAKKAETISTAQSSLADLGRSILKAKGAIAVRVAEVDELQAKIKDAEAAMAEATAIRQKQNGAYLAETAEMKTAQSALGRAVVVLVNGASAGGAFLQQSARERAVLQGVIEKIPSRVNLKPKQLSQLSEFVNAGSGNGAKSKYVPQSMTVQGILKDMYSTFASDVESATEAEATQNREFELLIATKVEQLNLHKADVIKKEGEKAKLEQQLADESQLYDDTEAQMKADIEFFDETKAACKTKSDDWNARGSAREEELKGVTKAIEMLTSDDARELFAKANKPGKETGASDSFDPGVDTSYSAPALVQLTSAGTGQERAFHALKAHASAAHSMRLAMLAAAAREAKVGHFDAVLEKIDGMIATLKAEDTADIAKRDQCKEELLKANSTIAQLTWDIEVNTAKIEKLERSIDKLEDEKTKTEEEIAEVVKHMEDIKAERKAENDEFKQAKKDDQDAIALLMDTRAVLSSYYENHNATVGPIQAGVKDAALVQRSSSRGGRQGPEFERSEFDAPETEFSGKSARVPQAKGILSMLTMVIEDLSDEIKNSMKAEMEAQLEFERMYKAAEDLSTSLGEKKVQLGMMITRDGESKVEEEESKTGNEGLLTEERDYKKGILPDCNWLFGAFEERARKRAVEMEGLVTAKDFLAGYKPGEEALLASRNRLLRGA